MTVSYIRRKDANTIVARDESGEFEAHDGDSFDMGDGIVVTVMGPTMLGGGTFRAGALAVLLGLIGFAAAGMADWGKP